MSKYPPIPDDGLGLPDLQEWIEFFGGYPNIPPEAWATWDQLYEAYRERQKLCAAPAVLIQPRRVQGLKRGGDMDNDKGSPRLNLRHQVTG
jgi:hypothetical protein